MTQHPTPDETRGFAARLHEMRAAADAEHRALRESLKVVLELRGDGSADDEHDPDGSTLSGEWSRVYGLEKESAASRAAIDRAIARIEEGGYGLCLRCGNPIGVPRLEARPAAEHCIDCARAEQERR